MRTNRYKVCSAERASEPPDSWDCKCLWMMYLNSPQSIDPGTKNFFLSISGKVDLADFSTTTGIRSGYLVRIRFASADRFSTIWGPFLSEKHGHTECSITLTRSGHGILGSINNCTRSIFRADKSIPDGMGSYDDCAGRPED